MKTLTIGYQLLKKIGTTLLLCFISSIGFADNDVDLNKNFKYKKTKTIDKTFDAASDYKLILDGSFSDYTITTWNESNISFHVEISTFSNKESKAEEMLENINVKFNSYGKTIKAETIIKKRRFDNTSLDIDYQIMIPEDIFLEINNSYGDVDIDRLNRYLNVDLNFGSFSIDSLFAKGYIDISYGNAQIKYGNELHCYIDFGDIRINQGKYVNVEMDYSNGKLGDIEGLNVDCEFSEIEIENVLRILDLKLSYGEADINKVNKDFSYINIQSSFSDIYLNLDGLQDYSYDISTSFADIDADFLKGSARKYIKEDNEVSIIGDFNDSHKSHNIKIRSTYGDVEIDR